MADYKLLRLGGGVQRLADGAFIPDAPGNRDWNEYQEWLAADPANVPDPAETLAEKKARRKMEIKGTTAQTILGSFPDWKQRNMTARAAELVDLKIAGPLSTGDQAELDDLLAKWNWVKSVRDASNTVELTVDTSEDPDSVVFAPTAYGS
jgi:hypothetical protein